ncbi:MAG: DUF305 domain-containing protein [Candidatus Pacebacteria bacterium]|nr:DUF305 domain-containing protein [Candidatus Paceibacterota bacterium]
MNKETILIAALAFLVGGISGYTLHEVCGDNDPGRSFRSEQRGDDIPYEMHRMEDGTMMGNRSMEGSGMGQMMHMMVTSEKSFIEEMIPHHQEAVDTAKEVITRGGTTPEVKTLVENIVVAQEKEIAEMEQWYETWYGTPYQDTGTYQPMMCELASLSGSELDKAFLSDMIMHHMGAIMMARSVQPYVEHDEIEQLTSAIVTTQSEEITQMRNLLTNLQ